MECGEIWVRQRSDSDEENGERINTIINDNDNKWRQIRRSRRLMKRYYKQFKFFGWLRRKFSTNDRAKQADYLSSLILNI
ncbi:unnamed protein product [Onchocerca flexuosa]|uniref:DDE Tnp4 domain-containing protein n=2 Tax=Onchocerca flexuosa TaxID=387005 RepID=A0A183HEH9_9BILA|nr:unnamed protein product [Onchocerca flexuosa]